MYMFTFFFSQLIVYEELATKERQNYTNRHFLYYSEIDAHKLAIGVNVNRNGFLSLSLLADKLATCPGLSCANWNWVQPMNQKDGSFIYDEFTICI